MLFNSHESLFGFFTAILALYFLARRFGDRRRVAGRLVIREASHDKQELGEAPFLKRRG
jgi:hypothetical protein